MTRYRLKTGIEAVKFDGSSLRETFGGNFYEVLGLQALNHHDVLLPVGPNGQERLILQSGDWLVKDHNGALIRIPAGVFEAMFEPARVAVDPDDVLNQPRLDPRGCGDPGLEKADAATEFAFDFKFDMPEPMLPMSAPPEPLPLMVMVGDSLCVRADSIVAIRAYDDTAVPEGNYSEAGPKVEIRLSTGNPLRLRFDTPANAEAAACRAIAALRVAPVSEDLRPVSREPSPHMAAAMALADRIVAGATTKLASIKAADEQPKPTSVHTQVEGFNVELLAQNFGVGDGCHLQFLWTGTGTGTYASYADYPGKIRAVESCYRTLCGDLNLKYRNSELERLVELALPLMRRPEA